MRRFIKALILGVTFYALFGFAILPATLHLAINLFSPHIINQPLHLGGVHLNPFSLRLTLQSLRIGDLQDPILGFSELSVQAGWNSLSGTPHIKAIELNDPVARIVLDEQGEINLSHLLHSNDSSPSTEPQSVQEPANFSLALNSLSVNNADILFTDQLIAEQSGLPFTLAVDSLNLKLQDFNWPESTSTYSIEGNIQEQGRLALSGNVQLPSRKVSTQVDISQFDIKSLQPYVTDFSHVGLNRGFLTLSAELDWLPESGLSALAQISVDQLKLIDRRNQSDVLAWKSLALQPIEYYQHSNSLTINQIQLLQPEVKIAIDQSLNVNLASLLKQGGLKQSDLTAEQPIQDTDSPISFSINQFDIENGFIDFADYSFQPGFVTPIRRLNGQLTGLTLPTDQTATLVLKGQVDRYSPVNIKASLIPSKPLDTTSINMSFNDVELTTLTPYSGRFAGYLIEKGHMDLDLNYQVTDAQLEAHNAMLLDNLTLGEPVDSQEAIELPLKLAIALLKDRNGHIDIQLPVSGDLNNPEFELGSVMRMALTNMLGNIVAAPFDFLASLVGGDAETMSSVQFAPGTPVIPLQQTDSLNQLFAALHERPEVELDIRGTASIREDWPLIAQAKIENAIELSWQDYQAVNTLDNDILTENIRLELMAQLAEAQAIDIESASTLKAINQQLVNQWPYDEIAMRGLAIERSKSIKNYLVEQGLSPERLFILDANTTEQQVSGRGVETRMEIKVL
ncbi:DUF748 domain-containing protein [Endozoicomonas euniceicola]|uniref:DUF748 domain-containing protein n=1 Tax=Endozoicomonas euniceicola TaxID=1234143 RepID=A0ABY6GNN4_9GAMM|nr:DUF748 domain-containing protein [Endozoicomonas euniceicola]UYM14004.1 DUF748 domain-containing protein [Endozoicomonas euniceicola]